MLMRSRNAGGPARRLSIKAATPSWALRGLAVLAILALAWPAFDGDVAAPRPAWRMSHGNPAARTTTFALSSDGTMVALASEIDRHHFALHRVGNGPSAVREFACLVPPTKLAFSPDGRFLAAAGVRNSVSLYDLANDVDRAARVLTVSGINTTRLAFSPDGRSLAVATDVDGSIAIWGLDRDGGPVVLHGRGTARDLQFSPDGGSLAAGEHESGTVRVWDLETLESRSFAMGPYGSISSVAFSPDGAVLAAVESRFSRMLWLWDWKSGQRLPFPPGEADDRDFHFVRFSPDGSMLVAAGQTGTIRFWDRATGKRLACLSSEFVVPELAISNDSRLLAVSGFCALDVRLWRVRDVLAARVRGEP